MERTDIVEEPTSISVGWWAFAGGVLLGAMAGVLLAPQPGSETRRQLARYAQRQGEHLRSASVQAKQWLSEAAETRASSRVAESKSSAVGAEALVREPEFAGHAMNGR